MALNILMKYENHYFLLIANAMLRAPLEEYTEIHHIRPRSLNGTDEDNTVRLTLKEHRLAHLLLFAMGFQNQIFSVAAICDDRLNKHKQHRFRHKDLKVTKFIRQNLAKTQSLYARLNNRSSDG